MVRSYIVCVCVCSRKRGRDLRGQDARRHHTLPPSLYLLHLTLPPSLLSFTHTRDRERCRRRVADGSLCTHRHADAQTQTQRHTHPHSHSLDIPRSDVWTRRTLPPHTHTHQREAIRQGFGRACEGPARPRQAGPQQPIQPGAHP